MITALRLGNTRLFDEDGWYFPFNSLTALCGTNSAGKSTVLKALLLLRLNISIRTDVESGRAKLRFSGAGTQIDLGNFTSFISHNCTTKQMHLGVSISTLLSPEAADQLGLKRNPEPEQDREVPYSLHCDFYFGVTKFSQEGNPTRADETIDDLATDEQAILRSAEFRVEDPEGNELIRFSIALNDAQSPSRRAYKLTLPKQIVEKVFPSSLVPNQDTWRDLTVPTALRGLLPDRWSMVPQPGNESPAELFSRPLPLPPAIEEVLTDLRRELNSVVYLGPLRAAAKRYYTLQQDYNLAGDTTGEFLPYLLRERPNQLVFHASPIKNIPIRSGLSIALDYWLHYLRTGREQQNPARELNVSNYQDVLVQLQIRSSYGEEKHALTDSGFGYSQVLPILARGLLLPLGATLIIEQPEVHLNPALQVRLADFFIAISSAGKQVVIETHSEHLIDALRARSAEDTSGKIAQTSMVLFLDFAEKKPVLHDLRVKEDGTIPAWPASFFGEGPSLSSRILKAQRLHRSNSKED